MAGEQGFDNRSGGGLVDRYRRCPTDDLTAAYTDLGAAIRVIDAQRLAMLAVLDEREAWRADGARDTAGWVAQADTLRLATARARADVARALPQLPAIAAAAAEGRLSFDQLHPLTTLATPADDERWATEAPGMDPGHLHATATRARRVAREAAEEQRGRRCLRAWRTRSGGLRGSFFLPAADGDTILNALDARAQAMTPPDGEPWEPLAVRRADALVERCTTTPSGATGRPTVVVHAQAGALTPGGHGWVFLPDGTPLARSTLHRLGCDANLQLALSDGTGRFVGLSAARRTVPRRIRRLLQIRDRCCRFPGCEADIGLHAHHLRFWSHGGRTEPSNLALLCTRHHTLVHEAGWTLTGDPDTPTGLVFTRPDGRALTTTPKAPSATLRARLLDDLPPSVPDPPAHAPPTRPAPSEQPHHPHHRCTRTSLEALRARIRAQVLAEDPEPNS